MGSWVHKLLIKYIMRISKKNALIKWWIDMAVTTNEVPIFSIFLQLKILNFKTEIPLVATVSVKFLMHSCMECL